MKFQICSTPIQSVVFLLFSSPVLAMGEAHSVNMMWDGRGFMGPFIMIFSGALIVFLGIILLRWLWPGNPADAFRKHSEDPVDILNRRLAAGEIEKEEYEEKRRLMGE